MTPEYISRQTLPLNLDETPLTLPSLRSFLSISWLSSRDRKKLDDLLANRRDLEEVLMFKSTQTLQLDAESTVTEPSSKKSQHKIEVSTLDTAITLFSSISCNKM